MVKVNQRVLHWLGPLAQLKKGAVKTVCQPHPLVTACQFKAMIRMGCKAKEEQTLEKVDFIVGEN